MTLELSERRPRRYLKAEHIKYEYSKDEDQLRERSRTINRHTTTISIPPTLIYTPSQEQQTYKRIEPTIIIYSRDTLEQPSYTSIKNIRTIKSHECLWIDISGVNIFLLINYKIIEYIYRYMMKIYYPLLVNDLKFIH
jgi:hypothetical protein